MNILFQEIQDSGSKKGRDQALVITGLLLFAIIIDLLWFKGQPGIFTLVMLLASLLSFVYSILSYARLVLQIRPDGIYVRYPPFQSRFAVYKWEEMLDVYIRSFDAREEYGGWGIRRGLMGKGYILPGNKGIQIIMKNKERVLITTSQAEAVANLLPPFKH